MCTIHNAQYRYTIENFFLCKLTVISRLFSGLYNIPSTSAQIERFVSISGLVCDKRRFQMKNNLIIELSLPKMNMHTLEEIEE